MTATFDDKSLAHAVAGQHLECAIGLADPQLVGTR
jgi:hypothetical protein